MAPVRGRPFVEWLLLEAIQAKPAEIIFCLSHKASVIESHFGDQFRGIPVSYTLEELPLGTGGAIRLGLEESRQPWSLILNGDSYCHVDWLSLPELYEAKVHPKPGIVTVEMPDVSRYGKLVANEDDFLVSFEEKSAAGGRGLINSGVYLVPREAKESIPGDEFVSWEKNVLPKFISSGIKVFRSEGPFIDIGTPESYQEADDFFKKFRGIEPAGSCA